ncbi:MAG: hypothetical protein K2M73_09565 [Lachnospiraceae bacterium]|nr:hypothetical protein [Lachnospiraceae bacterium]
MPTSTDRPTRGYGNKSASIKDTCNLSSTIAFYINYLGFVKNRSRVTYDNRETFTNTIIYKILLGIDLLDYIEDYELTKDGKEIKQFITQALTKYTSSDERNLIDFNKQPIEFVYDVLDFIYHVKDKDNEVFDANRLSVVQHAIITANELFTPPYRLSRALDGSLILLKIVYAYVSSDLFVEDFKEFYNNRTKNHWQDLLNEKITKLEGNINAYSDKNGCFTGIPGIPEIINMIKIIVDERLLCHDAGDRKEEDDENLC